MTKLYDLVTEAITANSTGYLARAATGGRIDVPTTDGGTAEISATVIIALAGHLALSDYHANPHIDVEADGETFTTGGARYTVEGTSVAELCWVPTCDNEAEPAIRVCREHLDAEVHPLEPNDDPARLRRQRIEAWRERVEADLRRAQTAVRDLDAVAPREHSA
ncbi:hypothetical protein B4N89_27980 [Embleya scabrispora]|uniref:Uncharacterized protein n=1 Tax=Embleya scabrispora TaxID=159449 RepID=A0A1T3P595_9ACTN|nr:hypothetical protein [Embleya scabrispora]OPC84258.1 hypothetical protein B4N89_27980 [Embleya scabrispora]